MQTPHDIRKDFPSLHAMGMRACLDSAASSLTPNAVIEAMGEYYAGYRANVHRGMYKTAGKATERYEAARGIVARFLNASAPEEIVLTGGTTASLNLLAASLGRTFGPGDEVVLTEMEHHANLVPWQEAAKRHGFALKFIPLKEYRLDMGAARTLITPQTKAVAAVHASNVLGTVIPAKELAVLAHAVGAVFILDAAQSVPHLKVDVRDLECDFLAFSAHKAYGPTGAGVLYGKKALLEKLEPAQYGGDMIREVTYAASTWNDAPMKFEAGTPNIAGMIGLGAAMEYLETIGMEAIEAHDRELTAYALESLSAIPGVTIVGPDMGERIGVISFQVAGAHPHDLATLLDREGVAVRGGHHCAMPLMDTLGVTGTCRASFGIYNGKEDVDLLCAAIEKAKAVLKL